MCPVRCDPDTGSCRVARAGELHAQRHRAVEPHGKPGREPDCDVLDDEQRQRLLTIAGQCPVHKVLVGAAAVTVSDRLEAL